MAFRPPFSGLPGLPATHEARVPAKHDGTVAQTGTVSSVDEEKTHCKSSARAIRCAKRGHRLTQCTGHRPFVFPQIFSSFPQNSITERQPSQSGDCLPLRQSRAFANAGRFRRQQRIACCGAGSYRHVLILFVHIDRGRGRMCFCKSLAHCRKTQLPIHLPLFDPAVPAKSSGTVAQTGTVSSVDEEKPIANQAHALSAVPNWTFA
jgi:hypothetical protein